MVVCMAVAMGYFERVVACQPTNRACKQTTKSRLRISHFAG